MSINWKEGLRRVWLVFAVIWWIVGLVVFALLYGKSPFYIREPKLRIDDGAIDVYFLVVIGFPFLVPWIVEFVKWIYSIGFKFVNWLIEGFKEDKPPIIEEKDSTEDKEK